MRHLLLGLCCVLLLSAATVQAASAPQLLATASTWSVAGQAATVAVTLSGVSEPAVITAQLFLNNDATAALASAAITINSVVSASGAITLPIPASAAEGAYSLRISAAGTGAVALVIPSVRTTIAISASSTAVFVECDKSLYQPGQSVSIVAIAIDHTLKPVSSLPLVVELVSPSKFKIRRWSGVQTDAYGMVLLDAPIAAEPEQGLYVVNVLSTATPPQVLASANYTVAQYVLPKFSVSASCAPGAISPSTEVVRCVVRANYTYGASVSGVANVTLTQVNSYSWGGGWGGEGGDAIGMAAPVAPGWAPTSPSPSSGTVLYRQLVTLVDGQAEIVVNLAPAPASGSSGSGSGSVGSGTAASTTFPSSSSSSSSSSTTPVPIGSSVGSASTPALPWVRASWGNSLLVEVGVTESASGATERTQTSVQAQWASIRLALLGEDVTFKPGQSFRGLLVARDGDDQPVDGSFVVSARMSFASGASANARTQTVSTLNGVAAFQVDVPLGCTSLDAETRSDSSSATSGGYLSAFAAYSPSQSFLSLSLSRSDPSNLAGLDPSSSGSNNDLDLGRLTAGQTVQLRVGVSANHTVLSPAQAAGDQVQAHFVATSRWVVVSQGSTTLTRVGSPTSSGGGLFSTFSGSVSLELTPEMTPLVRLVVYFVAEGADSPADTEGGEVVADTVSVLVHSATRLGVSASFSAGEVLPGADVSINVQSSTPAAVLLTAVDHGLTLLGGAAGRVQVDQVLSALSKAPGVLASIVAMANAGKASSYSYSGVDAPSLFARADLVVASSSPSSLPSAPLPSWYTYSGGGFGGAAGAGGQEAGGPLLAGAPAPSPAAPLAPQNDGASPTSASGSGSTPAAAAPVNRLRSYFPESWIRTVVLTASAPGSPLATTTLKTVAPDSVSSFTLSAVGVSAEEGMGFSSSLGTTGAGGTLKVFQPFFLSAALPPFAVRGEVLPLVVNVFNYLLEGQDVSVVLSDASAAEVEASFDIVDRFGAAVVGAGAWSASVQVPAGGVESVTFFIKPVALGLGACVLRLSATSPSHADSVEQRLSVRAEGFRGSYVINTFSNLQDPALPVVGQKILEVDVSVPADTVQGSARLKFTATADLMSSVINNVDRLVQMPTGCGEQNMITFAPLVSVMDYLTSTGGLTADIGEKARGFMVSGYARELTYQHSDASFSAFGSSDAMGSMWLSAFVLRVFAGASRFVYVDPLVLSKIGAYVRSHQNADGSIANVGSVVHGSSLFGGSGSSGSVGFTAFVLLALTEAGVEPAVASRAQVFVEAGLPSIEGKLYAQALAGYVLAKRGSTAAGLTALKTSLAAATSKGSEGSSHLSTGVDSGLTTAGGAGAAVRMCYSCGAASFDVEATGYYALMLLEGGDVPSVLPLAKWLLSQQNGAGGFYSTQDTTVAIAALAAYGAAVRKGSTALEAQVYSTASISAGFGNAQPLASFTLDSTNYDLLQVADLTEFVGVALTLRLVGVGQVLTQFTLEYNTPSDVASLVDPVLGLTVAYNEPATATTASAGGPMVLTPCVALSAAVVAGTVDPGMTLAEVGLFTGYEPDRASLDALVARFTNTSGVKRWDFLAESNRVALYLEGMQHMPRVVSSSSLNVAGSAATVCVQFAAFRSSVIAQAQPAASSVYSYYSPQQRSSFQMKRSDVSTAPAPVITNTQGVASAAVCASAAPRILALFVAALALALQRSC